MDIPIIPNYSKEKQNPLSQHKDTNHLQYFSEEFLKILKNPFARQSSLPGIVIKRIDNFLFFTEIVKHSSSCVRKPLLKSSLAELKILSESGSQVAILFAALHWRLNPLPFSFLGTFFLNENP